MGIETLEVIDIGQSDEFKALRSLPARSGNKKPFNSRRQEPGKQFLL